MIAEMIALLLISFGVLFFVAGTVGLLRFPDTLSRLHALTKADNLGLGLVVLGLMFLADSPGEVLRLLLIWLLVLVAGATASHLVGQRADRPDRGGEGGS
ncbi:MAG: monovalent cation/H(+) antiporter subunit G [Halothiobacillaceae bacterium]